VIYAPGPSRRRAFAEVSDRIGAPEPALFLDVTVPVPFFAFWGAHIVVGTLYKESRPDRASWKWG